LTTVERVFPSKTTRVGAINIFLSYANNGSERQKKEKNIQKRTRKTRRNSTLNIFIGIIFLFYGLIISTSMVIVSE